MIGSSTTCIAIFSTAALMVFCSDLTKVSPKLLPDSKLRISASVRLRSMSSLNFCQALLASSEALTAAVLICRLPITSTSFPTVAASSRRAAAMLRNDSARVSSPSAANNSAAVSIARASRNADSLAALSFSIR